MSLFLHLIYKLKSKHNTVNFHLNCRIVDDRMFNVVNPTAIILKKQIKKLVSTLHIIFILVPIFINSTFLFLFEKNNIKDLILPLDNVTTILDLVPF